MLVNNKIYIFLKNSYVLKFTIEGNLKEIIKLKSKLGSNPIILNNSLIYLDTKNKLRIIS